jgi:orotate phosphoribosyltransferase-like protein
MKTHHISTAQFDYPISRYFVENLPLIKKMLGILLKFCQKNYKDKKRIVFFCRGSSGAIISGLSADYFLTNDYEVYINHIKKKGESSHDGSVNLIESDLQGAIIVIIDDFVASGKTIKAIVDKSLEIYGKDFHFDILCISGELEKASEIEVDFEELPIDHIICE